MKPTLWEALPLTFSAWLEPSLVAASRNFPPNKIKVEFGPCFWKSLNPLDHINLKTSKITKIRLNFIPFSYKNKNKKENIIITLLCVNFLSLRCCLACFPISNFWFFFLFFKIFLLSLSFFNIKSILLVFLKFLIFNKNEILKNK